MTVEEISQVSGIVVTNVAFLAVSFVAGCLVGYRKGFGAHRDAVSAWLADRGCYVCQESWREGCPGEDGLEGPAR